jgi:hypothetical protein
MALADFKSQAGHTRWEEYKSDQPITTKEIADA